MNIETIATCHLQYFAVCGTYERENVFCVRIIASRCADTAWPSRVATVIVRDVCCCLDHAKKTVELSGDKSQVDRQQRIIQQQLRKFSDQTFDLEHIKQTQGRQAFLQAFSSKPDVTAPAHWTRYKGNLHDVVDTGGRLVPANDKLHHAVSELLTKTWNSQKVGVGNDAVHLHHHGVSVSNVWQIENVSQYKRYVLHMKEAYKHNSSLQIPKISGLQGEKEIETLVEGTYVSLRKRSSD